jgi:hypothetical protein
MSISDVNHITQKIWRIYLLAVVLWATFSSAAAQDFRGSIKGVITEQSGAVVPGARVTLTNAETGVAQTVVTNGSGVYAAFYLISGNYRVEVSAPDFKKFLRENIQIRVGDKLTLDLQLEVGSIDATVVVDGSLPQIETANANIGQVIDSQRISELPLADGNPFTLTRLAGGITNTGGAVSLGTQQQPFANATTSQFRTDGAPGGNEFTLDGIPNTATNQNDSAVAFVPPADAVQEFRVSTATFDAQQGHTAGANIEVSLKSGTNNFHGTLYEFVRNDAFSANTFFANRVGSPRQALRYNRYGATIGGPVFLPKFGEDGPVFYNGRNRSFFFFSYEAIKQNTPSTAINTVPTAAFRAGDFRALLAQGITIYDPLTARVSGGRVIRDPVQCNGVINVICPNRISPIALNYLQYYPLPNQAGDASGLNNFNSFFKGNTNYYNTESLRFDQVITGHQRFFARFSHNFRLQDSQNFTGTTFNGISPSGVFEYRSNYGAAADYVWNITPTTLFNLRGGYTRYEIRADQQSQGLLDPASLGFPASTLGLFGGDLYLPRFTIGGVSSLGGARGSDRQPILYTIQPTLTKIFGNHTTRFGYDFRIYKEDNVPPANTAGVYTFGTEFTRQNDLSSTAAPVGQQFAAFLLGLPTNVSIERPVNRFDRNKYQGVFVQDDWKVSKNLTLNLGFRYEYENPTQEKYNRNTRGFDLTAASPISAAALAAYALNPISEIPVSRFQVRGGLIFADSNHPGFTNADKNNFEPRIGAAYRLNDKTVLRVGLAIYTVPLNIDGVFQPGYSQTTNYTASPDRGLTFTSTLANPFPGGVVEPAGNTLGLATFLGQNIQFLPEKRRNPQTRRFTMGIQRELPGGFIIEAAYVGSRSRDISVPVNINAIPAQYLSTGPVRDQARITFLTALVTNPFANLTPGSIINMATVARSQLLRPFPEFGDITTFRQNGTSSYDSVQFRVERRLKNNFSILATYTFSKLIDRVSLLNQTDTNLEKVISADDAPHHFSVSGIWQLPFGRNQRFGKNMNRLLNYLIGGFQIQGLYQYQTGRPLDLGNIYFNGDLSRLKNFRNGNVDQSFDTGGFYFSDAAVQTNGVVNPGLQRADPRIRLESNIRTLPSRVPNFREQSLKTADISIIKNIRFSEHHRLQFRAEFLNAFNTPLFINPNLTPTSTSFGAITQQGNRPRDVQLGIKYIF